MTENSTCQPSLPIVGIVASAGGLAALEAFFDELGSSTGLAFVVIQHLAADHETELDILLSRHTTMPVTLVEPNGNTRIAADNVYVAPPKTVLSLYERTIHARPVATHRERFQPGDCFCKSLAEHSGPWAVGIVLSGAGSDGTVGLRHIKDRGGLTFVQDPTSARFATMPRNAMLGGAVDEVLAPSALAQRLRRYGEFLACVGEGLADYAAVDGTVDAILALVREKAGYDFQGYKRSTISRRVARRMALMRCRAVQDYLDLLIADESELQAMAHDLCIGVTRFFREPALFSALTERVLPDLVGARDLGDLPLRAWIAGCASGEEAYSLAMVLTEFSESIGGRPPQLFATDIDEEALLSAREGLYSASITQEVSSERIERFFDVEGDGYRVKRQLRELVVFATQNIVADPPFSRMDLVSCRNLLIYLERDLQRRVLTMLHFALREHGVLLLGSSETVGSATDYFTPIDKGLRIFRRSHLRPPFTADLSRTFIAPLTKLPGRRREQRRLSVPGPGELTERALLATLAPAAVLVDENFQVQYFHGPTSRFLTQPAGEPTRELLSLAHVGLRTALRSAMGELQRTGEVTSTTGSCSNDDGASCDIRITARRVEAFDGQHDYILVTFEDDSTSPSPPSPLTDGSDLRIEAELHATREELRRVIEDFEASTEELRASNEEVVSMNEELQSTNEELETSKEELQSLNEELSTVNAQLCEKVEELERTNNDLHNLLVSSDITSIFLDAEFRIKRFTTPATRLFKLIPSDVGRPISDLSHAFTCEDLIADAREVLDTLRPVEREVQTESGRFYTRRVLPYRTSDNRIEGVVVTFHDIHELKEAERQLKETNESLEEQVDARTALLSLVLEVSSAANRSTSLCEALPGVLEATCKATECSLGRALAVDEGGYCLDEPLVIDWISSGREAELGEDEEKLEGALAARAATTGEPQWGSVDCNDDEQKGLVAVPVTASGIVAAVLFFRYPPEITIDERLLSCLGTVGKQLGRVTERERAAEDRRERQRFLEKVADAAPFLVYVYDLRQQRLVYINSQVEALLGWSPDELCELGENVKDRLYHPDERDYHTELRARIQQAKEGEVVEGEVRLRHRNDSWRWFHCSEVVFAFDGANQAAQILGTAEDVTEKRRVTAALEESEHRLRAVFSEAEIGLVTIAGEGASIEMANRVCRHLLGYESEGLLGRSLFDVTTDEDGALARAWSDLLAGKRLFWEGDLHCKRVDESSFWGHATIWVVGTLGEPIRRGVVLLQDATERRLAEQNQERTTARIMQAQKLESLGVLAGGIAHDFNNILTGILGHASLATLNAGDPVRVGDALEHVVSATRCAAELCSQLLTYAGHGEVRPEPVNASELIGQTAQLLELSLCKRAHLELQLMEDLPPMLADGGQVRQVVMNLVVNASEASSDCTEDLRIVVRTGAFDSGTAADDVAVVHGFLGDRPYGFIEVADNGCGMDEATMERIFDPFYSTKFAGRGLGLAAVRGIVLRHGGALAVESSVGQGTTFRVYLPVALVEQTAKPPIVDASQTLWTGTGKVLLVDDEPVVRTIVRKLLERLGFIVISAEGGDAALSVFDEAGGDFVAILLDMTMPGMSGDIVADELAQRAPDIPIIMMSGYCHQDIRERLGTAVKVFIQKPLDINTLEQALRSVLA